MSAFLRLGSKEIPLYLAYSFSWGMTSCQTKQMEKVSKAQSFTLPGTSLGRFAGCEQIFGLRRIKARILKNPLSTETGKEWYYLTGAVRFGGRVVEVEPFSERESLLTISFKLRSQAPAFYVSSQNSGASDGG